MISCDFITTEMHIERPPDYGIQRRFLPSVCATRNFTIFRTSVDGSGLSVGNWMVPLEMRKPLRSFLKASMTEAVGKRLQWFLKAANQTRTPLCLNAGTP